jgi:asparagine synthase (glutamine-hydrolysing)
VCGITGWIDWRNNLSYQESAIRKMVTHLCKRGPDATNTWVSEHVTFGHTRLIVVDPEGGNQPMRKTLGGFEYTVIYNGELYNTEDLRRELIQRGHRFQSHSDTEVLLVSYMEWGSDCVERLNGIFAFAIWDKNKHRIFAARDRLGIKL